MPVAESNTETEVTESMAPAESNSEASNDITKAPLNVLEAVNKQESALQGESPAIKMHHIAPLSDTPVDAPKLPSMSPLPPLKNPLGGIQHEMEAVKRHLFESPLAGKPMAIVKPRKEGSESSDGKFLKFKYERIFLNFGIFILFEGIEYLPHIPGLINV